MKALRRLAPRLMLALLVLLAGCGGPDIPLTGVITDAYTGKPVPNAAVSVGKGTAQSDNEGRYRLDSWDPEGQLVVSGTGYEQSTLDLKTRPELENAQGQATVDLTIRPNAVAGLVTDKYTNQPIAGAIVQAGDALSVTTSTDGRYTLNGVTENFNLAISAPGYDSVTASLTRATEHNAVLRPNTLSGQLKDKYTSQPIAGAKVSAGQSSATTDAEGRYTLANIPENAEIVIEATGYTSQTLTAPQATALDLTLRPSVVTGTVADMETGQPISRAIVLAMPKPTFPISPSVPFTGTAVSMTESDEQGRYRLENVPEGAQIQVLMPGYRKAIATVEEGKFTSDIKIEPFEAKGIYITAATASSRSALTELFDMIEGTEVNSVVIDVKLDIAGDVGRLGYISKVPVVQELGTHVDYIDMKWIVDEARRRNIYTIARMPIMRDDILAQAKPEWGVKNPDGSPWADHGGLHWLDPFQQGVRDYNLAVTKEIADYGFDEIQYDYIRFPSDGDVDEMRFSQPLDRAENGSQKMYEAISGLLKDAHQVTRSSGTFFSIDVFGYATWRDMWEIGQKIELMAPHVDYICPMIYPSHYSRGELGFDNVDAHPYEIVLDSLERGRKRIDGTTTLYRPWLQAFNAVWLPDHANYDRSMIRKQIQAVDDFGPKAKGWLMWNAANSYDPEWFDRK